MELVYDQLKKNVKNCNYELLILNDAPDIDNGDENYLNVPRGLPLDTNQRSAYVQQMPIGLRVFDRIHSAIASAERRLLTNPHEEPDLSHMVSPISMLNIGNNQQTQPQQPQQQNTGMYGLLPRSQAPIEFQCGVCFEKIYWNRGRCVGQSCGLVGESNSIC